MEDVTIWGYNYLENLKPEIVGKGFSLEGELNFPIYSSFKRRRKEGGNLGICKREP